MKRLAMVLAILTLALTPDALACGGGLDQRAMRAQRDEFRVQLADIEARSAAFAAADPLAPAPDFATLAQLQGNHRRALGRGDAERAG